MMPYRTRRSPPSEILALGLAEVAALLLVMAACASPAPPAATGLRGSYKLAGGGAALELVTALIAGFEAKYPKVHWEVLNVGSRSGMDLLRDGGADLAMSSAEPDAAEPTLKLINLGTSGVGIAVNAANPVKSLTRAQVRQVFSGAVTDWSAVGGQQGRIVVLIRQATSAIRTSFTAFFFEPSTTFTEDAIVVTDLDETLNLLRSLSRGVAMVRLAEPTRVEPSIRLIAVDGVPPTRDNVLSGAYPVQRPLYLVYEPSRMKPVVQAFLDYVQSPEGQAILASGGGP